jgi:hypothetical protein
MNAVEIPLRLSNSAGLSNSVGRPGSFGRHGSMKGVDAEQDLELIAAGLRRDAEDTRVHGQVVLESLAAALPPELARVERSGGLLRKAKVSGVSVSIGDRRYVLKATAAGLAASVCHESGGIVMSSTPVAFDAWVNELLAALSAAAGRSSSAALALRQLAINGTTAG